ncbi:MAG: sigma-54 dependent transcriptional regulator [Thermoanaerobaculales bacterium]|jgi:two-component system response regulator AtoC|nr:sigma-54 dependent transcriptional regulator [Thermoanaerobaculales bacterium]
MARAPKVWVVDDEPAIRELLSIIVSNAGYEVEVFSGGAEVLACADPAPGAVLLDLMMPEVDGIQVLKELKRRHPSLPVFILTAVNEVGRAVEVTKLGAEDYLVKPIDQDRLRAVLHRALAGPPAAVAPSGPADRYDVKNIVGSSAAMRRVYDQIARVAGSDITVFVAGESGTGKELVARAIHSSSMRSDGPFIDVNCAAIPEGLQESELFGHEKGAFTGALATHPGKFEQAAGGTIFLDEVGEMSPSAQARLLRVLQERCLQRVGGTKTIELDVRVVSASNRDLESLVKAGSFRHDLYYRLVVFPIELPPLRERAEDIPLLVDHFIAKYASDAGRRVGSVDAEAMRALQSYPWPGNVRELENVIHRTLLVAEGPVLEVADLPPGIEAADSPSAATPTRSAAPISVAMSLEEMEKAAIEKALARHHGNLSDVARQLGIGRSTLYRKLEQYGLRDRKDDE